jgi:hypothetical protein
VLHRYDAPAQQGASRRDALRAPRLLHARQYEVIDAEPNWLDWYETEGPTAPDATLLSPPVSSAECMVFRLMRDVGDKSVASLPWLYVVHTDVPDNIVDEYNAWYDEEHLPRLVRVPGIVRARRYAASVGHPRYLTAYELSERDAFSSPAGLQARKTPWTEKMRSLFTNTRRFTGHLVT